MILYNPLRKLQQSLKLWSHSPARDFKSRWQQLIDFRRLYNQKGLFANEYLEYDFDKQSEEFRRTFLGLHEQRFYLDLLNPKKYYILARNKYLAHKILEEVGVRQAQLYCYYQPEGCFADNSTTAHHLIGVLSLLKSKQVQSCIIKATEGSHGDEVVVVHQLDYEQDDATLHLFDGTTRKLSQMLSNKPLLFESLIQQTAQIAALNASSVNTVRFMTTLYPDGSAQLVATFIKIGRSRCCVDNAGTGGNIDACVDTETGELKYAIQYDGEHCYHEIEQHPDTQSQINGIRIENWESIKAEVLKFQQAFPYIKAAGWDIAITEQGPVVVEVNDMWDRLGQLFLRKGWRYEIRDCYLAWQKTGKSYDFGRLNQTLSPSQLQKIVHFE